MLDVFNQDAFGVVPLTDAINNVSFRPGRIGQLGLFEETGVATTSVAIEGKDDVLELIAPSPRGAPGTTLDKEKRNIRQLRIPHFEVNDAIMAEEVQGVRAWGSDTAVETVMAKVAERFSTISQSLEVTQEYARIGAIKGIVTYADDTTMNLFSEFDVSQESEVDFDLDNASAVEGALREKCAEVVRLVADNLGGIPYAGIHAFCGSAFFDDLIAHKEVRETYLNQSAAAELRSGYAYGAPFTFGGITFEEYRGKIGAQAFINTDKCHIFPIGVPGLFRTYYAPADYVETVNTLGQRLYSRQYQMPNGKGVNLDVQMNALNICTRPKVLIKGKRT